MKEEFSLEQAEAVAKTWPGKPSIRRETTEEGGMVRVEWYYPTEVWDIYPVQAYSLSILYTGQVSGFDSTTGKHQLVAWEDHPKLLEEAIHKLTHRPETSPFNRKLWSEIKHGTLSVHTIDEILTDATPEQLATFTPDTRARVQHLKLALGKP